MNKTQRKEKQGGSALIGNAGEYYVMAELLKRKTIAAQTPRNTHAFDILATDGDKTAKIRVKTKSEQYDHWQWNIKKDGVTIFLKLTSKNDFTVLVNLKSKEDESANFYVIPTKMLDRWLKKDFKKWVETPGRKGRPHDPNNKRRHLEYHAHKENLEKNYRNKWNLIFRKSG